MTDLLALSFAGSPFPRERTGYWKGAERVMDDQGEAAGLENGKGQKWIRIPLCGIEAGKL